MKPQPCPALPLGRPPNDSAVYASCRSECRATIGYCVLRQHDFAVTHFSPAAWSHSMGFTEPSSRWGEAASPIARGENEMASRPGALEHV